MPHSISSLSGANVEERTTERRFALGTTVRCLDNKEAIYVQATGAIAGSAAAIVTQPAMTVASGAGAFTNGTTPFVSGEYGFIKKTAVSVV